MSAESRDNNFGLFISGQVSTYETALALATLAMFAKGFHQFGTCCNALDIAPKHAGSVFGLMNTAGSSAGTLMKICAVDGGLWNIFLHLTVQS